MGIVFVSGAGNAGSSAKEYPQGYDNVIAVGGTDANDQVTWFSNYGTYVELMAPAINIVTATAD